MNILQTPYNLNMEIQKVVATNLKAARGKMSRNELAKRAGVTYQAIYDVEERGKNPSIDLLQSVSEALGIPSHSLLRTDEIVRPVVMDRPVSHILKKLSAIPDEIYELAAKVGPDDKSAWDNVKSALEVAIELKEERAKKA